MLELKNVNTNYDFLQILWDVSLDVDEGEFVALVGPNGAGKTTTLRTIAGLLTPKSGEVLFKSQSIGHKPAYLVSRMGISYVSEELNLFTDIPYQGLFPLSNFMWLYGLSISFILVGMTLLLNKLRKKKIVDIYRETM